MPRTARFKPNDSIFHIMIHSISEINLFNDSADKDMYLYLIKKSKVKYNFKLYTFCLMNTHAHFIIDCFGSDISKIMHYLNLCYSMYYNRKYVRRGPLFQDRFKSKVVDSYKYLANVSAYIHSNPKDLLHTDANLLDYPYNSLIDYLNNTDRFNILDSDFLIHILGLTDNYNKESYLRLINKSIPSEIIQEIEVPLYRTETRTEKTHIPCLISPDIVVRFVASKLKLSPLLLHIKYNSRYTKFRALTCFMLNSFSNLTHREICLLLGNISQARVSTLIATGLTTIQQMPMLEEFINLNKL